MRKAENYVSTSFHGETIRTTPKTLIKIAEKLGAEYFESNTGYDKTNFDFDFETSNGIYFTVYDWKEYRKLKLDDWVSFHIGAKDKESSMIAFAELHNEIRKR